MVLERIEQKMERVYNPTLSNNNGPRLALMEQGLKIKLASPAVAFAS